MLCHCCVLLVVSKCVMSLFVVTLGTGSRTTQGHMVCPGVKVSGVASFREAGQLVNWLELGGLAPAAESM